VKVQKVPSGIKGLDRLIGGFYIGDNVMWHIESGTFIDLFCLKFLKASLRHKKPIILISFNNSPKTIITRFGAVADNKSVTLIDCFSWGKGEGATLFTDFYPVAQNYQCSVIPIEEPQNIGMFNENIEQVEEELPPGSRYIIDSLTGMMNLWGDEAPVLKFFTRHCPRLYELQTVAYWILERGAHSESFRAQINHITQVAINLSARQGDLSLTVLKAERREESAMLKARPYEIRKSNVEFPSERRKELGITIGRRIREVRQKRGMSQAELAKHVGVAASTISQVESEQILLSLPALIKAAQVLEVSTGALIDGQLEKGARPCFRQADQVLIKIGESPQESVKGMSLLPLDFPAKMEGSLIEFLPGSELYDHFFNQKGEEMGYLLAGELELELCGERYSLTPGDTIYLTLKNPTWWKNKGDEVARLIWIRSR
jgi:transcriptional regulator with XRE-family HTH domain